MNHSQLVEAVMVEMSRRGHLVWKNIVAKARPLYNPQVTLTFGVVGSSDILGFLKGGRGCSLECKTGDARTTKEQKIWIARCQALGVVAGVVRKVSDLEELLASV